MLPIRLPERVGVLVVALESLPRQDPRDGALLELDAVRACGKEAEAVNTCLDQGLCRRQKWFSLWVTLFDVTSFSFCADVKNTPLGSMLNFDAGVKEMTARHPM